MKTMRERVKGTPCTVKCRLGVDEFDSYDFVRNFISEVAKNGNV
jgi:tRNA-dihydrouridine synthase